LGSDKGVARNMEKLDVADGDDDDDDDDDDDSINFGDDVEYSSSEIIVVKKTLALMHAASESIKLFMQCMPLFTDDIANIDAILDMMHGMKESITDAGAELYSPIEIESVRLLTARLFESNMRLYGMLKVYEEITKSEFYALFEPVMEAYISQNSPWDMVA